MARQARPESSTGYYHVMLRGINREYLFKRDKEKKLFLEMLKEQGSEADKFFELAAYCLMDNHVHLMVKAEKAALSKLMKVVSLKFAAHYNRIHNRIGPVFGDRFRSEGIEDDAYLLGAIRYIHMNPVKAKITDDMSQYMWSSYNEYLHGIKYLDESQRSFMLEMFNGKLQSFIAFHARDDDTEHLETPEDTAKNRRELASRIMESFCVEKGITTAKELVSNPALFEEMCRRLTEKAGLSLRQTAELLETSLKKVFLALHEDA